MPLDAHRCIARSAHSSRATFVRTTLAMFLGLGALQGHAAPLTLEDALRLAQERSRQLPAQEASATAARHMAVAAGQLPDPTLKAGINNLPINGPDRFNLTQDFMTMRSVGVMQEFTHQAKRAARAARFEREARVAEAMRNLALANLQRDTAVAWFDRLYQERMRDVLLVQRDEARLQIEAADAAYRAGRGSQADAFAARSAVAQIEDRIAQSEREIATTQTQLARWVGAAAAEGLGQAPDLEAVRLKAEDLETQLAHHPQIAVMLEQEAVARSEADIARADKTADLSVELMVSQRGPAYSNMVSLSVSIPLQWDQKNRQDRELAAKLAAVEQAIAEREEATRIHVAETLAMLQEWRSDRDRLTRYDASQLPLAAERTRAALAGYRGGSGPLNAVLEARRAEIDTRMERLRLEMNSARLWAQLEYLVPAGRGALEKQR